MNRPLGIGMVCGMLALSSLGVSAAAAETPDAVAVDKPVAQAEGSAAFARPGSEVIVKRSGIAGDDAQALSTPRRSIYKVKNKRYVGEVCGTTKLRKISGAGKTTLVMTIEKGVEAKSSAQIEISKGIISAGMSFDVTKSYTVKDETRFEVPRGRYGFVEAYPLYDKYEGDIYFKFQDRKTGAKAYAMKPVGVCFNQWTKKA